MNARKLSSTAYPIPFFMASSVDHVTGVTGIVPVVTLSKNATLSFGAALGAVTEAGNGWYWLAGNATDRNTLGNLLVHATGAGADPYNGNFEITSYDPFNTVGAVWDEVLTGATHNVPSSAGRRLRQIAANIIIDGTVVSATENTIKLDAGASSVNGAYDPSLIYIELGLGAGQCRLILEYDGATRTAVVDRDWKTIPNATSEYVIVGNPGREHVNEGLARGGSSNTIILNALASNYDNAYNGQIVFIRSGYGEDQAARVIAYDGTTKTATVAHNWNVIPDATSAYVMLPTSTITPEDIRMAAWGSLTERTLTQAALSVISSVTSSGNIIIVRGDTLTITITGLPSDISDNDKIWFTYKRNPDDLDSAALIMIDKTGLVYLNGAAATLTNGSITTPTATSVVITLVASETAKLSPATGYYDIQKSKSGTITTPCSGLCTVINDITRATS